MAVTVINKEIKKLKNQWKGKIHLSNNMIVEFSINKSDSWKQWGASPEELWITMPIVEKYWTAFVETFDDFCP